VSAFSLRRALVAVAIAAPLAVAGVPPAGADAPLTITATGALGPVAVGASPTVSFSIDPNPGGASVHLDWTVRSGIADTDPVVRSGSADATTDVDGVVSLTFDTPAELGEGTFGLEVVASDDAPGTGPASGTTGILPVVVDNPPTVVFNVADRVFYPVRDEIGDYVRYGLSADQRVHVSLDLLDAGGTQVAQIDTFTVKAGGKSGDRWGGRVNGGQLVAAGEYFLQVTSTDSLGQVAVNRAPIRVSLARLRGERVVLRMSARQSLQDKTVGACSSLVSPSSHRWAGSQGYYSLSRCSRRSGSADVVVGLHSVRLPRSVKHRYGTVTIWLYGGKARGAGGSGYLILGGVHRSGRRLMWNELVYPNLGWHRGQPSQPEDVVQRAGDRRFVSWTTGLSDGSRYDVKSFKLVTSRALLKEPDGTVVWPRS
jgi:hypothetical protein